MAIKKTSKTSKTSTAKKTVSPKSAAPKKAAKPAVAASKKASTPARKPAAPASAPAVKRAPSAPALTVITAAVDVGFGNALYLRGEGPGLSWDKGVLLDCISAERWTLTIGETSKPVAFKFLLNDVSWSDGEDYVVAPGSTVVLKPAF